MISPEGIPYEEILKEQEEKGVQLILIASHRKTMDSKILIFGIIMNKVMKRAE